MVHGGGGDGAEDGGEGVSAEAVLEDAGEFGVAEGDEGALFGAALYGDE